MSDGQDNREAQKLLDALARAGFAPELKLIRECLARRELLTPGLLQMLATNPYQAYDIGPDGDDPRSYAPIHAGNLLIAYGETKAIPLFVEILRDPERASWLIDADAYIYGRAAATEVLSRIGRLYPQTREHVTERLLAFLPRPHEISQMEEADEVWSWAGYTLAQLSVPEALPRMEALFEAAMAETDIVGDWEEYEGLFEDEPREVDTFNILDTYRYLQWRADEQDQAREQIE